MKDGASQANFEILLKKTYICDIIKYRKKNTMSSLVLINASCADQVVFDNIVFSKKIITLG